ncbi:dihydrofolate reductase [Holzapfeliella sp. JNUCC 72]
MSKLAFIWAEDQNHLIGKDGNIPWFLPADLKFFKDTTKGHPVVMGRRTFDSLNIQPLPARKNIVLTRDKNWSHEGVEVFNDKDELLRSLRDMSEDIVFIIGGTQVYRQLLDDVDLLYLTQIHHAFEGDTHMPEIDYSDYELISKEEGPVDDKNEYPHTYLIYKRK